ncbi:MAG TPA: hypothetical protein VHP38_09330 [Ruminiclostridium sp.]|nr:hypothetical protein [Ruminiclostridium sp.]
MSVLSKIAYLQGIRGEIPNQILAKELAETENIAGIKEIASNLFNKDKNIQSDCLKVLYEVGYIKPELISDYVGELIKLLKSRNNRLVWGAMIALAQIAPIKPGELYNNLDAIYSAIEEGSVITIDNGIKVLAIIASKNEEYNKVIFPYLINHLRTCRQKEVGQHSESMVTAVNLQNKDAFLEVLKEREISLTNAQLIRVKKLYRKVEKLNNTSL